MLQNRLINRTTKLSGESVKLVLPGNLQKDIFERLAEAIKQNSGSFEILVNPERQTITNANGPIILAGNLADNMCVEYLYYQFLSATDKWYPGPD